MTSSSKLVLYDFEWQALRTSLDFSTEKSTQESLQKCKDYLNEADINKVWRILNLMSATRMGFSGSSKLIKDQNKLIDLQKRDELVESFRIHLSNVYGKLKNNQSFSLNQEDKLIQDLENASTEEFGRVYESLIHRYENSKRSEARQELRWYLELMKKVLYTKRDDQQVIEEYANKALKRLKKSIREQALKWNSN